MGGYNTNRQQQKQYTRMQMDGSSLKKHKKQQQQKTEKHHTGYSLIHVATSKMVKENYKHKIWNC